MFKPDDDEDEDSPRSDGIAAEDELASYQSLVPNSNPPFMPSTPAVSSKYSEVTKAFMTTPSMAVFTPSLPGTSTSATVFKNEPPTSSSSGKTANAAPSASSSVLFCELCGAKNSHATKKCPQIAVNLICELCDMKNSHVTKDCPQIATRVRCGRCGELGHPIVKCTKNTKPVHVVKEEPGCTSDDIMLVYDSWDGKDEKPDVQELKKMNQSVGAVQMGKVRKKGSDNLSKGKKRSADSDTFANKKCKVEPMVVKEEVIVIDDVPEDIDTKSGKKIKGDDASRLKTSNVNLIEHAGNGEGSESSDIEILSADEAEEKSEILPKKRRIERLKKLNRLVGEKLRMKKMDREVKELEERLKSADENRKMEEDTGEKLVELLKTVRETMSSSSSSSSTASSSSSSSSCASTKSSRSSTPSLDQDVEPIGGRINKKGQARSSPASESSRKNRNRESRVSNARRRSRRRTRSPTPPRRRQRSPTPPRKRRRYPTPPRKRQRSSSAKRSRPGTSSKNSRSWSSVMRRRSRSRTSTRDKKSPERTRDKNTSERRRSTHLSEQSPKDLADAYHHSTTHVGVANAYKRRTVLGNSIVSPSRREKTDSGTAAKPSTVTRSKTLDSLTNISKTKGSGKESTEMSCSSSDDEASEPADPLKRSIYAKHLVNQGNTEFSFEELRAIKTRKRLGEERLRKEKEPDPESGGASLQENDDTDATVTTTTTLTASHRSENQGQDSQVVNAQDQIDGDGGIGQLTEDVKDVRLSQSNEQGLTHSILPVDPISHPPRVRKECGAAGGEILRDPEPLQPPPDETNIDRLHISVVRSGHLSANVRIRLLAEQKKDTTIREIVKELKNSPEGTVQKGEMIFMMDRGLLMAKDEKPDLRFVVPAPMVKKILEKGHGSVHIGATEMSKSLMKKFYWRDMVADIKEFVGSCCLGLAEVQKKQIDARRMLDSKRKKDNCHAVELRNEKDFTTDLQALSVLMTKSKYVEHPEPEDDAPSPASMSNLSLSPSPSSASPLPVPPLPNSQKKEKACNNRSENLAAAVSERQLNESGSKETVRDPRQLGSSPDGPEIDPLWISSLNSGHLSAYAITRLRNKQKKDTLIREMVREVNKSPDGRVRQFKMILMMDKRGLLMAKDKNKKQDPRFVVPRSMKKKLLEDEHGLWHVGGSKMIQSLVKKLYWPGMAADILKFVSGCCQGAATAEARKELLDAELELMQPKKGRKKIEDSETKDNFHSPLEVQGKDFNTDRQALSSLMTKLKSSDDPDLKPKEDNTLSLSPASSSSLSLSPSLTEPPESRQQKEKAYDMRSVKLAAVSDRQINNDSRSSFAMEKTQFDRLGTFRKELVELLKSHPERNFISDTLLLSQFPSSYKNHFGKTFNVSDYGQTKLRTLLESLPDIVQVAPDKHNAFRITLAKGYAQESCDVQKKKEKLDAELELMQAKNEGEKIEESNLNCNPSTGCCLIPPQTCSKCLKLRVIILKRHAISSQEATSGSLVIAKIMGAENLNTTGKLFKVISGKQLLQFKLRSPTLRVFNDRAIVLAVLTANGPKIIPGGTVIGHCQMMSEEVTAEYKAMHTFSSHAEISSDQELSLKAGINEQAKKISLKIGSGGTFRPFDVVVVSPCREEVVSVESRLAIVQPGGCVEVALKNETSHNISNISFVNPVAQLESIEKVDDRDLRTAVNWMRYKYPTSLAKSPDEPKRDQNISSSKTLPPSRNEKAVQSVVLLDRVRTELTRRSGPYLLSLRGVSPGSKYVKVTFSVAGFLCQGTLPVYDSDKVLVSYDPELNADRSPVPLVGDVIGEWSASADGDSGRTCCGGVHHYRAQSASSVTFKNPALRPRLAAACEDDCPCIEFGHGCEITFAKPIVELGEDKRLALARRMELSVAAEVALEAGDVVFSAACCHSEEFVKKLAAGDSS